MIVKGELIDDKDNSILANNGKIEKTEPKTPYKVRLVWRNIAIVIYTHLGALYGVYLMFTSAKIATTIYGEQKKKKILCM